MNDDPMMEEASKWFEKLNRPSNAAYRIAHARHENSAAPFDPDAILSAYRRTKEERMRRLEEATKMFPDRGADSDQGSAG